MEDVGLYAVLPQRQQTAWRFVGQVVLSPGTLLAVLAIGAICQSARLVKRSPPDEP
jgi:hypothetical protein